MISNNQSRTFNSIDPDSFQMKNHFDFRLGCCPSGSSSSLSGDTQDKRPVDQSGTTSTLQALSDSCVMKWQSQCIVWVFTTDGSLLPTFVSQKTQLYHKNGNGPEPSGAWRERLESHKDVSEKKNFQFKSKGRVLGHESGPMSPSNTEKSDYLTILSFICFWHWLPLITNTPV